MTHKEVIDWFNSNTNFSKFMNYENCFKDVDIARAVIVSSNTLEVYYPRANFKSVYYLKDLMLDHNGDIVDALEWNTLRIMKSA